VSKLQSNRLNIVHTSGSASPQRSFRSISTSNSTIELLERARGGENDAISSLFARLIPGLRRWARGRLPVFARELCDTQDIVQDTVLSALRRLDSFEVRHPGALLAYLRQATLHRITDEVRRAQRRPVAQELVDQIDEDAISPFDRLLGRVEVTRYESALERLRPDDKAAILCRVEHQSSYEEMAIALGKPSANAARVAVRRALMRLAEEMSHESGAKSDERKAPPPQRGSSSRVVIRSATAVADGAPVNWERLQAVVKSPSSRRQLQELRTLARVAEVQRSFAAEQELADHAGEPSRSLLPADTWGHLAIVEQIGQGTFGEVYRARDPFLKRDVALKLLRPLRRADAAGPALHEALALARVKDPNVVRVHGADVRDGRIGLWMELISGRDLEQVVKTRGPLSPSDAIAVALQICRALAAVHDVSLAHRDVTARNVVLEENGRAVLTDFGASQFLDSGVDVTLAGTPLYLAPELLDGGPGSIQGDIYAVGVLVYHLVTGEFPVHGESLETLREHHRTGRVQWLDQARDRVPEELVHVVNKALATNPANRFRDMRDMDAALTALLVSGPDLRQMKATAGNLIAFSEKARVALGSRWWLVDRIATRVIRLEAQLSATYLERDLQACDWSFELAPFLSAQEFDAESLVFLGLYPSGKVRSVSLAISTGASGSKATLVNPFCLLDPGRSDIGEHRVHCEIEVVGLPYPD
jgi:RNA polymerase sigma factor (sigma-70 family)